MPLETRLDVPLVGQKYWWRKHLPCASASIGHNRQLLPRYRDLGAQTVPERGGQGLIVLWLIGFCLAWYVGSIRTMRTLALMGTQV